MTLTFHQLLPILTYKQHNINRNHAMAFTSSIEEYEVVTPALSKTDPVLDASSINEVSTQAELTNKEHAEAPINEVLTESAADKGTQQAIAVEDYTDGTTSVEAAEATTSSSAESNTVNFNGIRYVEASDGTLLMHCITINDIHYVPENMYREYKKTATASSTTRSM